MNKADLINYINSFANYAPDYGPKLSNHLPMALYALHEIGADEQRIKDFAADHIKARRLQTFNELAAKGIISDQRSINEASWQNHLGLDQNFESYRTYFINAIQKHGIDKTLETHIDPLMKGVGGATFHGMIRTAYGLDSGNSLEIAQGLAYWADSHLILSPTPARLSAQGVSLRDVFTAAEQYKSNGAWQSLKSGAPNIFSKMIRAASEPEFDAILRSAAISDSSSIADLQDITLDLYETERGFTSLHGVTATHAFRQVSAYCNDQNAAFSEYSKALLATYISVGAPALSFKDNRPQLDEADIAQDLITAQGSSNDHVIKLAHSAREEYRNTGRSAYLHIIKDLNKPQQP